MANSFMADIGSLASASFTPKKSTSREGNTEMKMEDFLYLMIVQLQNQTIDDTADTGEMLNQMVQMQMVTALANMTDASIMSYASSLVGKEVTIGVMNGNEFEERVLKVIGTGLYDGQQVIFCDDGNMYSLNQIMAVGRLPDLSGEEDPDDEKPAPDFSAEGVGAVGAKEDERLDPGFGAGGLGGLGGVGAKEDERLDPGFGAGGLGGLGGIGAKEDEELDPGFNLGDDGEADEVIDTENGIDDPFYGGLLDGMLEDPNGGNPEYTGEQGVPTDTE